MKTAIKTRLPPEEERQITREVLLLVARIHPLKAKDGRSVVPDDATPELAAKIRRYEGELLWARGFESGPRWGCAWVPAGDGGVRRDDGR